MASSKVTPAAAELLPLVYGGECGGWRRGTWRRNVPAKRCRQRATVHEAYLRLVGDEKHPVGRAAAFLRGRGGGDAPDPGGKRRRKRRLKHGGQWERVELAEVEIACTSPCPRTICWRWMKPWSDWRRWIPQPTGEPLLLCRLDPGASGHRTRGFPQHGGKELGFRAGVAVPGDGKGAQSAAVDLSSRSNLYTTLCFQLEERGVKGLENGFLAFGQRHYA